MWSIATRIVIGILRGIARGYDRAIPPSIAALSHCVTNYPPIYPKCR
jgi:hypothetical protein